MGDLHAEAAAGLGPQEHAHDLLAGEIEVRHGLPGQPAPELRPGPGRPEMVSVPSWPRRRARTRRPGRWPPAAARGGRLRRPEAAQAPASARRRRRPTPARPAPARSRPQRGTVVLLPASTARRRRAISRMAASAWARVPGAPRRGPRKPSEGPSSSCSPRVAMRLDAELGCLLLEHGVELFVGVGSLVREGSRRRGGWRRALGPVGRLAQVDGDAAAVGAKKHERQSREQNKAQRRAPTRS